MLIEETRVAETRAQQLDLAARVPFTEDGVAISETRVMLEDLYGEKPEVTPGRVDAVVAASARALGDLAADDVMGIEVG